MPKVVDIGNSTSGPILFQCFNGCTYQTCPDACLQINYEPNLGVNSFFLAFFAVLLVAQGGLGYYYRTWGFTIGMACGLILEIAGYVGRILLHNNPFNFTSFLM